MDHKIFWNIGDWSSAVAAMPTQGPLSCRTVLVPRERVAHILRRELIRLGRTDALAGTRFLATPFAAAEVVPRPGDGDVEIAVGACEFAVVHIAKQDNLRLEALEPARGGISEGVRAVDAAGIVDGLNLVAGDFAPAGQEGIFESSRTDDGDLAWPDSLLEDVLEYFLNFRLFLFRGRIGIDLWWLPFRCALPLFDRRFSISASGIEPSRLSSSANVEPGSRLAIAASFPQVLKGYRILARFL